MSRADPRTVLVTGGAGYVGCVLVPRLLQAGYRVIVYDLLLFGSYGLPSDPHLTVVPGDIRDTERYTAAVRDADAVIHLACISNDPSFELDPELSKTINYDCFEPLVRVSRDAGVRRFIYASTSSVYGVSDAPEVTEDHPLVPLTHYNRYKGLCEPILRDFQSPDFTTIILRPATVCGYSTRMRFDLAVNIFTNQAVRNRKITIFGGQQKRPNIHIDDLAELYVSMLSFPEELVAGETFNVAYENHTLIDLAAFVRDVVEEEIPEGGPVAIEVTDSADPRSYHVSSRKIAEKLGYRPRRSIHDAVQDICHAFNDGKLLDSLEDDRYFNVRRIMNLGLR